MPLVVIVLPVAVAAKVIVVVETVKFVDGKVKFPKTEKLPPRKDIAPSNALAPVPKLMLLHTATLAVTEKELVPTFELLSKITSSADVGTPAPPLPPELVAQRVVVVASHVPDPPTQ
jgi:hypothetical protein